MVAHLRCSRIQFLETSNIAIPCSINFISLEIEKSLECEDEFKVGSRCDIVMPPQSGEVFLRHFLNTCLKVLAHLHHSEKTKHNVINLKRWCESWKRFYHPYFSLISLSISTSSRNL